MSKDIYFDNIIITDDINVANKWAEDTFDKKRQKIAKDSVSTNYVSKMNYVNMTTLVIINKKTFENLVQRFLDIV